MNRRDFLLATGRISMAGFIAMNIPNAVYAHNQENYIVFKNIAFKGTNDGKILQSKNKKNWDLNINFGDTHQVMDIFCKQDKIYTRVRYKDIDFLLKSKDGKKWYS